MGWMGMVDVWQGGTWLAYDGREMSATGDGVERVERIGTLLSLWRAF